MGEKKWSPNNTTNIFCQVHPNESARREAQRRPNNETTSASTCAGVGIEQVRMKCCLYHIVHLKFTDHSDVVMFTDIFYI